MKYIVKNCPATTGTNGFCGDDRPEVFCQDCTDCLVKKVINKCRNYDEAMLKDLMLFKSVRVIVRDILQLFEIEECE